MNGDSSIDPNLRDTEPISQPPPEYPSPADTTSNAPRPPPPANPQSPYQQHSQQYAPYPTDGAYNHTYFGPPPGHQYGQIQPPSSFQAPAPPRIAPSDHRYVSNRGGDAKRLRACEACRGLKVRCEPDPSGGPCKRCLKAGRKCEITPPSRKRQKKTDSRVSELEKQLADIQAQLKIRRQTGGSDSGGEQYGEDNDVVPFSTLDRHISSQPPYPQQFLDATGAEVNGPSPYMGLQTPGPKRLLSERVPNRPTEAHMYGPLTHEAQAINPALPHPHTSPEANLLASVRKIASSMDDQLGIDLLSQYLKTALPSHASLDIQLSTQFALLRRSKPVLFVAIMVIMLQARCKDRALPTGSNTNGEGAEKDDDQALHVLSEVAMGSSGQAGAGGKGHSDGADKHDARLLNPANAFIEKLRGLNEKDLEKETWFEEMLQGFQ